MKKRLLFLLTAIFLVSCTGNKTSNTNPSTLNDEVKLPDPQVKGKYAIKSGIVVYQSKIMGMDAVQNLYFDDFGAKEATQISMDVMGTKVNTFTVTKEGFVYNFDPVKKTGTKTSVLSSASNLNFEDLNDQVVKEWNLKKEGKESVSGKECDKYSLEKKSLGMKGNYWVWKGIAIKMDVDMSTVKMIMEATNIQENVSVPPDKFDIPADITF
jgi:hypothetical protein